MRKRWTLKTLLAFLLIFISQEAFGAQIKLAWDPPSADEGGNPLTDLEGYTVYYGPGPRSYDQLIDVPLAAVVMNDGKATYTLTGLTEGRTYFIAVTAYSTSPFFNESNFSNEVTGGIFTIATSPPGLQVVVDSSSAPYTGPQAFGWGRVAADHLRTDEVRQGVGVVESFLPASFDQRRGFRIGRPLSPGEHGAEEQRGKADHASV